jgi:Ca2+-binding EF-hand superfamily protein
MMKASHLIVAAALLPLAALAQTPTTQPSEPPAPQQQGTTFESLDADSDGRISKSEAESNAHVKSQFASYDLNGDGFIERAEVSNANKAKSGPQQP